MWVIHVEIAGQRQADSFLLTAGDPDKPREITVGRPPAKADTRPDIVVPEKSVSKIHAVLHVNPDCGNGSVGNRLVISDRSRFGTTVNGTKMELGGSQELAAGDVVQLAPRALLMVEQRPVVLAAHPAHPQLEQVRKAAERAGIRVTHMYDSSTTHVLYGTGDVAWSGLAQGALRGLPLADLEWLRGVASAGLLTNSLPSPPPVSELLLGPERPPRRAALPPPAAASGDSSLLLQGFSFGYSANWQDEGLSGLLSELGARVVAERPQGRSSCSAAELAAAVVELTEGGTSSGGGAVQGCLGSEELLTAILTVDAAAVRRLVTGAAAAAAVSAAAAAGSGRQAAAADPEASEGQADSDMTQAAEDDAEGGEVVEQRAGPGPGPGAGAETGTGQAAGAGAVAGARSQGQAGPSRLLPASAPNQSLGVGRAGGLLPASAAGGSAPPREAAVQDVDGWMVAARRPEDAANATAAGPVAGSEPQPAANDAAPKDAPAPKRRRLTTGTASQPSNGAAPPAAATTHPLPSLVAGAGRSAAGFAAPPAATAPAAAPPLLLSPPLVPAKHEPVEDAPWMTQHPHHGRASAAGGRRSSAGAGLLLLVKEEPAASALPPPPPTTGPAAKGKGKGGKAGKSGGGAAAAAAAADELGALGLSARVKEESAPAELLDASAQVVLEADLFAPTPEQLPPRCRSGSAEPQHHYSHLTNANGSYGGGGGGACEVGSAGMEVEGELPDFKQFRKQGGQLPAAAVQPLPVFLVDNFQRTDETEAFLRLEEERATNKRRADEAFKKADQGSKKPPRAPRR